MPELDTVFLQRTEAPNKDLPRTVGVRRDGDARIWITPPPPLKPAFEIASETQEGQELGSPTVH